MKIVFLYKLKKLKKMLPVKLMQVKIYESEDTCHTVTFKGTDGIFIKFVSSSRFFVHMLGSYGQFKDANHNLKKSYITNNDRPQICSTAACLYPGVVHPELGGEVDGNGQVVHHPLIKGQI